MSNDREEFVRINECDLLNWNLKNSIRNEIIVSNIEGNISDIIDVVSSGNGVLLWAVMCLSDNCLCFLWKFI